MGSIIGLEGVYLLEYCVDLLVIYGHGNHRNVT